MNSPIPAGCTRAAKAVIADMFGDIMIGQKPQLIQKLAQIIATETGAQKMVEALIDAGTCIATTGAGVALRERTIAKIESALNGIA